LKSAHCAIRPGGCQPPLLSSLLPVRSRELSQKTARPSSPTAPAICSGSRGECVQSRPPRAPAGTISRLRMV